MPVSTFSIGSSIRSSLLHLSSKLHSPALGTLKELVLSNHSAQQAEEIKVKTLWMLFKKNQKTLDFYIKFRNPVCEWPSVESEVQNDVKCHS